ncbi:DUF262 domain-containing protein [Jeotgalibaca ciconiae]|uniref:DUF262 domain-containing protein n=1 Tax=Jeotgalibaca ciconiae TaxID=2496265 RepID=A0A3Q9BNE2_9LACT|nr:DUF262 domain-containing protein [Jeotgalibaca ciconiae]AZP03198.1 DUF262 domain-containing protein [Jeotgalibaca ciconiae]AZP05602.1 DUF262 domain-containing protein [Jeotgalibaca ciconiae]
MEGNVRYLLEYLRGGTKFIIPVYQRNYDWKKENCERLLNDLINLENEDKKTHFFGSIVVKPGDYSQDIIVIDGQQRITTTSLLLLAMKNWMTDNETTGERINPNNINDAFLEDSFSREVDKFKLRSNPRDYNAYKRLFGDGKFHINNSNLTLNYEYFYTAITNLPISLDQLMNSIQKLQVMVVNLNSPDDNPQLIFESLNSTGVDLTDADKIRNFLLMNESQKEQLFLFENYWEPIENRTNFQLSSFFRDYLTLKNGKYPNLSKVYETFVYFYQSKCSDKRSFFDELSDYSYAYQQILGSVTDNKEIDDILKRLNHLQVTVIRPFLMAILHDYNQHQLNGKEVAKIFNILESYIARRMITKLPSNSLNKIISVLYRDMKKILEKEDEALATPSEVISYLLLTKINTGKFPTDNELIENLSSRDLYNINSQFRTYLFERLENYDHFESLQIYEGIQNQEYSIEHILPQKLSRQWIEDLGPDYKKIQTNYLNTLGNLTITAYNSKYSNRPFKDKQNMEKGFKESHFVNLNKIPARAETWGETEINERTNELIQTSLKIWPYPNPAFKPSVHERSMIIFDGEQKFTNYQIKGYSFLNDEYHPVETWKDFFIDVIKHLAEINSNPLIEMTRLNSSIKSGVEGIFSSTSNANYKEVVPGIYVYFSMSNWRKMSYIKQLLDIYDLAYDELSIDAVLYDSNTDGKDSL